MMMEDQMVSITPDLLQSLRMSKIFKDHVKDWLTIVKRHKCN